MSYVLKITNYHIVNLFRVNILFIAGFLLVHLTISVAIDKLAGTGRDAGMIAPMVMMWAFTLGFIFFSPSFEYLLSQGVTRRKFFVATVFNLAVVSAVCALIVMVYWVIFKRVVISSGMVVLYEGMYHNQNILSMVIWEFAVLFMLVMAGWLVTLVFYVIGTKTKIILYSAAVVLIPLVVAINKVTDGGVFRAIGTFLKNILGLAMTIPNPYIAAASFLVIAAIISGAIYLLLRRAQVNN